MEPVEIVDGGDRAAPALGVDAVRVRDEQHRVGARSELHALVHGRQKPRSPAGLAAIGIVFAGDQHDERRQILTLAPEPVAEPGPEARPADHLVTGVHEDLRRRVVELRRLHRTDDGDVVGDLREMRQQLRDLRARLSVLLELERRAQQLRPPLDEREPLALDELLRDVLPVVLHQRRLGIEQVDLRRRAGHEEIDDALGLGREMQIRTPTRALVQRLRAHDVAHQRRQRQAANPERRRFEEMTARDTAQRVGRR